jgi:predicted HTH domain antitoxin
MERFASQRLLASRGFCMKHDVEDFREDMATLRELGRL